MFTGLIEQIGFIKNISRMGAESRIMVQTSLRMPDLIKGESIAINGACLSVEDFGQDWFSVYASQETMQRTNLGGLGPGAKVNLERAMTLGHRLGGHLVSGHVDCLAKVVGKEPKGESILYRIEFPTEFSRYVVPKGSVALDGVSLTVNDCTSKDLQVNIIPATQKEVNISSWVPGRELNMEVDLIAKYVAHMLGPYQGNAQAKSGNSQGLTLEKLQEYGF